MWYNTYNLSPIHQCCHMSLMGMGTDTWSPCRLDSSGPLDMGPGQRFQMCCLLKPPLDHSSILTDILDRYSCPPRSCKYPGDRTGVVGCPQGSSRPRDICSQGALEQTGLVGSSSPQNNLLWLEWGPETRSNNLNDKHWKFALRQRSHGQMWLIHVQMWSIHVQLIKHFIHNKNNYVFLTCFFVHKPLKLYPKRWSGRGKGEWGGGEGFHSSVSLKIILFISNQ